MIGFHRALMERNKAKCILDAVKKHPCHFYIVTLYFSLDCIMLWNWNYLESSRMFYCSKDYMQEWSMHGTHGTANEEA